MPTRAKDHLSKAISNRARLAGRFTCSGEMKQRSRTTRRVGGTILRGYSNHSSSTIKPRTPLPCPTTTSERCRGRSVRRTQLSGRMFKLQLAPWQYLIETRKPWSRTTACTSARIGWMPSRRSTASNKLCLLVGTTLIRLRSTASAWLPRLEAETRLELCRRGTRWGRTSSTRRRPATHHTTRSMHR